MGRSKPSILVIYTGGTIGMVSSEDSPALAPINFCDLEELVPEVNKFDYDIHSVSFDKPLDSSDMGIPQWVNLVTMIEKYYLKYDGFVILHGTDTMSYTASALSFMCGNIQKPIIITGSQLPLGKLRTDGKEHLLTAIEMAALKEDGMAIIPEVSLYFNGKLFRGNRTRKVSSEWFNAYRSGNYAPLAEVGVNINVNKAAILKPDYNEPVTFYKKMSSDVALLKIHPGLSASVAESLFLNDNIKAVIIESYGSGNVPTVPWLLELLQEASKQEKIVLNVSQCIVGGVNMGRYKTSLCLQETGVCCGKDITTEAALTKLMFLLGQEFTFHMIKQYAVQSLRGEMSSF